MKPRWWELLYIALLLLLLGLYLSRPERKVQWGEATQWWQSLLQYRGLDGKWPQFQGEPVLIPPADFSRSEMYPLATFGGTAQYLGCDISITLGSNREVHVWLLTYWRHLGEPGGLYQVQYVWRIPGAEERVIGVHELNITRNVTRDVLLLPQSTLEKGFIALGVGTKKGEFLPALSPILEVEKGFQIVIWQP